MWPESTGCEEIAGPTSCQRRAWMVLQRYECPTLTEGSNGTNMSALMEEGLVQLYEYALYVTEGSEI